MFFKDTSIFQGSSRIQDLQDVGGGHRGPDQGSHRVGQAQDRQLRLQVGFNFPL